MDELFHEITNEKIDEIIHMKWTHDVETVLKNISHNCGLASEAHKLQFNLLTERLKYFKIPIIILSGINSLASIGLSKYIEQNIVSLLTACISLIVSSISSIELYLSIQRRSDIELISYKSFYILACKINSMLDLEPINRHIEGDVFLQSCLSEYESLFNTALSNGLGSEDKLVELIIKR